MKEKKNGRHGGRGGDTPKRRNLGKVLILSQIAKKIAVGLNFAGIKEGKVAELGDMEYAQYFTEGKRVRGGESNPRPERLAEDYWGRQREAFPGERGHGLLLTL